MVIQVGVPESLRQQAADLYIEAFRQKLTPILGIEVTGRALLAKGLSLNYAIAAVDDGYLRGIVGVHDGTHHFATIRPFDLIQTFGWLSGIRRIGLGMLLERGTAPEELLIDGIAVSETWRGKGVGTALLKTVITFARTNGYRTVRLEVVDTNPSARQLYERVGFMTMETQQTGWLTRRLGFESVTTMVKVV